MIDLPNFNKTFEYENNFYLSSDVSRIAKVIAHYELYKMSGPTPGDIVECGVFKGTSLIRFTTFQHLLENNFSKKIVGFDTFGDFPESNFPGDKKMRQYHIDVAGPQSISKQQLARVLKHKGIDKHVELVKGDITRTVPKYVLAHPGLEISLLNLDVDIYEPAKVILEYLYPKIVRGGVLLLDDYGVFPGETKAADEYFKGKNIKIRKFPFSVTPSYVIKE